MQLEDIPVVAAIEQSVSPHPWNENQFAESQQRHHSFVMIPPRRCEEPCSEQNDEAISGLKQKDRHVPAALTMTGEGDVVGFMIYTLVGPEAEILNIAIHPDYQSKGCGNWLLNQLIENLPDNSERLFLEVRVSNFPAIRLYQNAGFAELCVREGYYPTELGREDAIMMALELSQQ